jgi:hypothetical protein
MGTRPTGAALALLTNELVPNQWLAHRPPLGRAGPWLPAVDPDLQRLREKIIFSQPGWLLITMMILGDRDT